MKLVLVENCKTEHENNGLPIKGKFQTVDSAAAVP